MPIDDTHEWFWGEILSREPERIRAAFQQADKDSQAEVLQHLRRMVVEAGWHPEQRLSAQSALDTLKDFL